MCFEGELLFFLRVFCLWGACCLFHCLRVGQCGWGFVVVGGMGGLLFLGNESQILDTIPAVSVFS